MVSSVNTEDIRENTWLEGQEIYSMNSDVITRNILGIERKQET